MFLADNLKFLRKRRKKTQDDVAFALEMKRSTLNGYENGIGEPKLTRLIALADYYRISLDELVRKDLRTYKVFHFG
jgi:transcriptional regulator with XRE-family HTH domain